MLVVRNIYDRWKIPIVGTTLLLSVCQGMAQTEETLSREASDSSATALAAFLTERRSLAEEMQELEASGASIEELNQWHKVNATRLERIRQMAMEMAVRQTPEQLPYVRSGQIPEGASEAMQRFIELNASLQNSHTELLNGLGDATEEERRHALKEWHEQNAPALTEKQELAQQVAAEAAAQEIPIPADPNIPSDASPELAAFLTERHALMKEEIQIQNQHRSGSAEALRQALAEFRVRRAERMEELHETATLIFNQPSTPSESSK